MAKTLPTTRRGSNLEGEYAPDAEALKKCFELVGKFPDAAVYFLEHLEKKLKSVGLYDKSESLITQTQEFVQRVREQHDASIAPWTGQGTVPTDFQNYQRNTVKDSVDALVSTLQTQTHMDYAINDSCEFIRGYSTQGAALSVEQANQMDKVYNAWLAEHQLLTKDSVIYEGTAEGSFRQTAKGELMRADATKVRELLNDPVRGFESYAKAQGINLETQGHNYPVEKTQTPGEKATVTAKTQQTQVKESIEEVTPETPPLSTPPS